ncbi:MAG: hypothetical protein ACI9FJ_001397 [Alteromonadaceae bacterium]
MPGFLLGVKYFALLVDMANGFVHKADGFLRRFSVKPHLFFQRPLQSLLTHIIQQPYPKKIQTVLIDRFFNNGLVKILMEGGVWF